MRFPIPMLLAASIVLASTASSQTVSYQVGAFPPASWEEHISPSIRLLVAFRDRHGHRWQPWRRLAARIQRTEDDSGSHQLIVAWMNGGLAYDPSASGAVERFAFRSMRRVCSRRASQARSTDTCAP